MAFLFFFLFIFGGYSLTIYVKPFGLADGEGFPIQFDDEYIDYVPIKDVHQYISTLLGISDKALLLYFNGEELNEPLSSFKQYDITDGSTLEAVRSKDNLQYLTHSVSKQQKDKERQKIQKHEEEYIKKLLQKHGSEEHIKDEYTNIAARRYIEGGINELFEDFNDLFFMSMLSNIDIKWYDPNDYRHIVDTDMNVAAGVFQQRRGIIYLSQSILRHATVGQNDIFSQLLHEMIHAYLYVNGDDERYTDHGAAWLALASRINRITGLNITPQHQLYDPVDAAQHTESDEYGADYNDYFKMLMLAISLTKNNDDENEEEEDDDKDDDKDDSIIHDNDDNGNGHNDNGNVNGNDNDNGPDIYRHAADMDVMENMENEKGNDDDYVNYIADEIYDESEEENDDDCCHPSYDQTDIEDGSDIDNE